MREDLLAQINRSLTEVLEVETKVSEEVHLINDQILDSLDAATFAFELEAATGKKLPEGDLEEHGLYKVSHLIDYLSKE